MNLKIDSPIVEHGTRIVNLLILNFYWIVGSLPIVTAGASTIAAFSVTLKMTEDRDGMSMTRQFWSAWAKNMKHGVPLTLILLGLCYSLWMDFQLFNKLDDNPIGFLLLAIALIVLIVLHFLYVFPLEARYENGLFAALKNSRKIFFRFFLRSLGLIGILAVQYLLFLHVAPVLTYIGIFIGPILAIYTTSQIIMPIFRRIEDDRNAHDGFSIYG